VQVALVGVRPIFVAEDPGRHLLPAELHGIAVPIFQEPAQDGGEIRGEHHRSGLAVLRCSDGPVDDGASDRDPALVEREVRPLQARGFALAAARREQEDQPKDLLGFLDGPGSVGSSARIIEDLARVYGGEMQAKVVELPVWFVRVQGRQWQAD
jgi:hypothetical protein